MGRTIPLRRRVGIGPSWRFFNKLSMCRAPSSQSGHTPRPARGRPVAWPGRRGSTWTCRVHACWSSARRRASGGQWRRSRSPAGPGSCSRPGGPRNSPRRRGRRGRAARSRRATSAFPSSATRSCGTRWRSSVASTSSSTRPRSTRSCAWSTPTPIGGTTCSRPTCSARRSSLVPRSLRSRESNGRMVYISAVVGRTAVARHGCVRDQQGRARRAGAGVAGRASRDRVLQRGGGQHARYRGVPVVGPRTAGRAVGGVGGARLRARQRARGRCRSTTAPPRCWSRYLTGRPALRGRQPCARQHAWPTSHRGGTAHERHRSRPRGAGAARPLARAPSRAPRRWSCGACARRAAGSPPTR